MKVLNIGSINIDYSYKVNHFAKKGETISSKNLEIFSGGKGLNQSIALKRAGVDVYHFGLIGKDGIFIKQLLDNMQIDTRFVKIVEDARTGNAIIQTDDEGDNCIILYQGANYCFDEKIIDEVIDKFSEGDFVVLQNEINKISYIIEKAYKKGMKIVLNPSPINEQISQINLNYIHCIILNEVEARYFTKSEKVEDILLDLKNKMPNSEIILTVGEKGSFYIKDNQNFRKDAYKVNVVDTTSAGDTFLGYYLGSKINGLEVSKCIEIATKAAAIAVSKKGSSSSIPFKEEVLNFNN